jgi:hypothetical protein
MKKLHMLDFSLREKNSIRLIGRPDAERDRDVTNVTGTERDSQASLNVFAKQSVLSALAKETSDYRRQLVLTIFNPSAQR